METLTTAGVPENQAKAGAQALAAAFVEWGSGFLATRSDVSELKSEIASARADAKADFMSLKLELADVRSDIRLMKWMLVTLVAGVVSLVSKAYF